MLLRPEGQVLINALTGDVKSDQIHLSGNATYQALRANEVSKKVLRCWYTRERTGTADLTLLAMTDRPRAKQPPAENVTTFARQNEERR
jgi:hypothetical protein